MVEDGRRVYANVISSQIMEHRRTGGVVPEVAARRHAEMIIPTLHEALKQAENVRTAKWPSGIFLKDIEAIAVAQGPGLMGCLMVGNTAANALSFMWNKPLIPVHHIEGHLYANWLTDDCLCDANETYDQSRDRCEKFPILILTASGGHNQLILMKDHGSYKLLGETLDDAAGEAFDKVARMMGLPYPGGPEIQKMAANGNEANGWKKGDPMKYTLPRAMMYNEHAGDLNFSFSGLKTAVRKLILDLRGKHCLDQALPDLAASFEYTICHTLLMKLKKAADFTNPQEIHIAGGVSANLRLRKMLEKTFSQSTYILYPSLKFCTDNAAMIGAAAYFRYMVNPKKYAKWQSSVPDIELKFY